ncbi:MAG: L-aspartate oxidase [Chlamydiae bacterium]|nr:L-aspartate oxidase [Chlamydiota bacterium]
MKTVDCLIIGAGLAGLLTALELVDKGLEVIVLSSDKDGVESNSYYAQGGIVYKGKDDSALLLEQDIVSAGAGLTSPDIARMVASLGPSVVKDLLIEKYGVCFDKNDDDYSLTKEAAHCCPRILHSKDSTGRAIMQALLACVEKHPNLHLKKGFAAVDLITLSHHSKCLTDIYHPSTCVGAYVMDMDTSTVDVIFAKETVIATGGVGEVFLHTSNPKSARGDGLAMAYRAGARIMNMEYIQFHPTTMYYPGERRRLLSEALRGEGAKLLSTKMQPFMHNFHPLADLAPRDVVARGIYQEMLSTDSPYVYLDLSFKPREYILDRFPDTYHHCLSRGYDITQQPIPVVPAEHYSCGGIAVNGKGQTTIQRLYAIGEVACTGLHGANRLASTSLLEAVVFAKVASDDIAQKIPGTTYYFPPVDEWCMSEHKVDAALIHQDWMTIKQTMWNYVGLVRDNQRLSRALKMLEELKWEIDTFYSLGSLTSDLLGLRNGVQTALLITQGAIRNKKSIGCHYRVN